MTRAADPLAQPLRLLREASLRPGFEELLAERLSAVAAESKIVHSSRWKYRRGIFLLAALALPAGALAARGWFGSKHGAGSVSNPVQQVEPAQVRKPAAVSNIAAPKVEQAPPTPSIEDMSNRDAPAASERRKSAQRAKRTGVTPDVKGAERPTTSAPGPKIGSSNSGNAPAKIESLDVDMPRSGDANDTRARAVDKTSAGTGLRSAASESASRAAVTRDRLGADRDRAGDRRGNDGAQQARERVQARERKGQ